MSSGRYNFGNTILNSNDMYKKYLDRTRGLKSMLQFRSPTFKYPTEAQLDVLEFTTHYWQVGDRFFKLADEAYGDPQMWWVIAMFNQSPTEAFVKTGDTIYIPTDLDAVLGIYMDDYDF